MINETVTAVALPRLNRMAMVGWVALPVHLNELDSLLEALHRGADLMMYGPGRAAACKVADRLTNLRRELSRRPTSAGGPA